MENDSLNYVLLFGNSFALFFRQYLSVSVSIAFLFLVVLLDLTDEGEENVNFVFTS